MDIKKYNTLKSNNAAYFIKEKVELEKELTDSDGNVIQAKEERDGFFLIEKRWDSTTGQSLDDKKLEILLADYEMELSNKKRRVVSLNEDITNLEQIIKDIAAL